MTRIAPFLALAVAAAGCQRCGSPSTPVPPGAGTAGRVAGGEAPPASAVLATIPQGVEVGEAVFSRDGRHVAWVGQKGGATSVYLDGHAGAAREGARGLVFHEASGALAYVAAGEGKERVVVGTQEGPPFDEVGTLRFTRDGQALYSARRSAEWFVVAGGHERAAGTKDDPAPFPVGDRGGFAHRAGSSDGSERLALCAADAGPCATGKPYRTVARVEVDRQGRRAAMVAEADGKQVAVDVALAGSAPQEKVLGAFASIAAMAIDEGGSAVAFLAARDGGYVVIGEGALPPLPAGLSPLELRVQGKRVLVTGVLADRVVAFLDGQQLSGTHAGIYFPVLSDSGGSYAFVSEEAGKESIHVDGRSGPPYDKVVTPRFTPDGTKVVYRARQSGERFVVVADATGKTLREHPHYEAVYDVVIAPDGKSVGYGVRKGAELRWVVEPL